MCGSQHDDAYSSDDGLTSVVNAFSFTVCVQLYIFLLRKHNVLFDFLVMLFMCGFQERPLLSVTPSYLLCGTFSKSWLGILYS
jgi:hypothetical protein